MQFVSGPAATAGRRFGYSATSTWLTASWAKSTGISLMRAAGEDTLKYVVGTETVSGGTWYVALYVNGVSKASNGPSSHPTLSGCLDISAEPVGAIQVDVYVRYNSSTTPSSPAVNIESHVGVGAS